MTSSFHSKANSKSTKKTYKHFELKLRKDRNDKLIKSLKDKPSINSYIKELIKNEKNPDNSWVGELKWENGIPKDDKTEFDFLDRRSDTDETEQSKISQAFLIQG